MTRRELDTYANVREVLARIESRPRTDGAGTRSVAHETRADWDMGLGYDRAIALYRDGWQDGAQQVERVARTLTVTPPKVRRMRFTPEVAGAFPDVPAYLAGDPQSMYAPAWRELAAPRYVTMYVPIVYNGNVPAQAAMNRGIAFAGLIDALEHSGLRVQVQAYVNVSLKPTGTRHLTLFGVKDYRDPLNLEDLIFAVAHPAMLRRVWFALAERSGFDPLTRATQSGYGCAESLDLSQVPDIEDGAVTFPNLTDSRARTPEQYLREAIGTLPASVRDLVEG